MKISQAKAQQQGGKGNYKPNTSKLQAATNKQGARKKLSEFKKSSTAC